MKKIHLGILVVLLVAGVVIISGCTSSSSNSENQTSPVNVTGITVESSGYGSYKVFGTITPSKDIDYLQISIKWYDAEGNVIERSSLAWNTNEAKAGESIKFDAFSIIPDGSTPSKFDLFVFDSAWSGSDESDAVYQTTVNMD